MKTHGDWQVSARPGALMRWTSPTGTVHDTHPHGGALASHLAPDTVLFGGGIKPSKDKADEPANPVRPDDPPNCANAIPDPWDGVDLQELIDSDPMSPEEYQRLLEDTRRHRAPPDPEAPPEIRTVVSCTCPPPF